MLPVNEPCRLLQQKVNIDPSPAFAFFGTEVTKSRTKPHASLQHQLCWLILLKKCINKMVVFIGVLWEIKHLGKTMENESSSFCSAAYFSPLLSSPYPAPVLPPEHPSERDHRSGREPGRAAASAPVPTVSPAPRRGPRLGSRAETGHDMGTSGTPAV